MKAAADAGARSAHYTMLRLLHSVKEHFKTWLYENSPDRAEKVLSHVRDTRGGGLYVSTFGERMTGTGRYAEQIADMMTLFKKRYGLHRRDRSLSVNGFRRNAHDSQLSLF